MPPLLPRRFRFGLLLTQRPTAAAWAETARRAEALGFSTLLVPDHFDSQLSPIPALMAAADATTTLRVGTQVANNDFRHPLGVAKEAATVDLLSGGRFELGLGAGFRRADYDPTGIRFDEPAARVERLEEAVGLIRSALRGERITYAGRHYRVDGYTGAPAAVQASLPIMIGGGGPRLLRLAGRHADIVGVAANLGGSEPLVARDYVGERIEQKLRWIREGAGDRLDAIELQNMVVSLSVTDDAAGAYAAAAARFGLTPAQAEDALLLLFGSVDAIVEKVQSRRERFGISYLVFYDDAMEDAARIVERLAGS